MDRVTQKACDSVSYLFNQNQEVIRIGYERVSTTDQNMDLQLDALKKQQCERFFTDKLSGSKVARPGLEELKHILRKGDQVVVWKLDRLGRCLRDL